MNSNLVVFSRKNIKCGLSAIFFFCLLWLLLGHYGLVYRNLPGHFGRHIASSTLPPAQRFLIVEADAKDIDGFPLEFFRKAAESPKYYIGGMPPAQRKMWDAVLARQTQFVL